MKQFTQLSDVSNPQELIEKVLRIKGTQSLDFGKGKNLAMLFFNPSLRTRMSTQTAAYNLGMSVSVLEANQAWKLESELGAVMNGDAQEHIQDAIRVMSLYTDILAVRAFPSLTKKEDDYSEKLLNACINYSEKPVISLESATRHPLQSLTDVATIHEFGLKRPKIAVTWAPHPKCLPQAVVNSFLEWSTVLDAEVVLAHPVGYGLDIRFTKGIQVTNNQEEALEGADFVYCKNWSSYTSYGQKLEVEKDWMISEEKMAKTNAGKFMHCLPVRRNVVVTDAVLDASIVYHQAGNRLWSAQAVLHEIIKNL